MVENALDELGAEVLFSLSDERKLDNKVIDWFVKEYESNKHYTLGFLSLMPKEFIDDVDNIKKMLERDGNILYEVPDQYKNDLKMVDLAVKGGANRALYTLQTNIKQDVNNIIKYGVFDVEPNKIKKLKDGLNYKLEELVKAVGSSESSALPIPIAAKLMSEVIEPLVLVEVNNKNQGAGQFLEETMNALPLSKRLALGVLFSKK